MILCVVTQVERIIAGYVTVLTGHMTVRPHLNEGGLEDFGIMK